MENPDILQTIAKRTSKRPKLVVGFAAETENLVDNAREKLKKKGCDLIVANDVSKERGVFGGEQNTVQLVSASGVESWGLHVEAGCGAAFDGATRRAIINRQGMTPLRIMRLANGENLPLPAYEITGCRRHGSSCR